jgi:hypothetical protein
MALQLLFVTVFVQDHSFERTVDHAFRTGFPRPGRDEDPAWCRRGRLAAEAERITAEEAREAALLAGAGLTAAAAGAAAAAGRRGPGMPGSAHPVPGVYASRASGFASGIPLDTAPGA